MSCLPTFKLSSRTMLTWMKLSFRPLLSKDGVAAKRLFQTTGQHQALKDNLFVFAPVGFFAGGNGLYKTKELDQFAGGRIPIFCLFGGDLEQAQVRIVETVGEPRL